MRMDDQLNTQTATASSVPIMEPMQAKPKTKWSVWTTYLLSALALVCSVTAIVLSQSQTQAQTPPPVVGAAQLNPQFKLLQNQIKQLEQSQEQIAAQIQSQHQQIQKLRQEQPSQTVDWEIQKARSYLELAQINAEWSQNRNATLNLLRQADFILVHSNHPNTAALRQAIAQDIAALSQIPSVDIIGILAKLKAAAREVTQLNGRPAMHDQNPAPVTEHNGTWRDNLNESVQQLEGFIRIHHQDDAWMAPLNPEYLAILRENIRMNIQQAELGLVEQHASLYTAALNAAIKSICFGFQQDDPKTKALIQSLQDLKKTVIAYPIPKLQPYQALFDQHSFDSSESLTDTKVTP